MNPIQKQVQEFHEKFGVIVRTSPNIGSDAERKLRARLILEEAVEFAEAAGLIVQITPLPTSHNIRLEWSSEFREVYKPSNLIEMADALADINYVVMGSAVTLGIDIEPINNEVHRSNMSKVWPDGTVHKDEGGKVIKPPSYSPADLIPLLRAQGADLPAEEGEES